MKIQFTDAQNTEVPKQGWIGINPAQGFQIKMVKYEQFPFEEIALSML